MAALASGLATLLALTALEVSLRVIWDRPRGHYIRIEYWKYMQPDAELGQVPKPNVLVKYPRFQAAFTTNSLGLRGRECSVAKTPGVRRIVVLGDSFAWGHGVGSGRSFPEVLESLVPNAEVINLGVPGFNVRTGQRYFERIGAQHQPDIVLLALCQNDIHDLDSLEQRRQGGGVCQQGNPEGPAPTEAGVFRVVKQSLDHHSYVYAFCISAVNANKTLARVMVRLGLKEELAGFELLDDNLHASLTDPPLLVQRAISQIERDLLRLDECVRSHGGRLLVAMIPSLQAVEPGELVNSIAYTRYEVADFDVDQPYRLLGRFMGAHGIRFINPLAAFREEHAKGKSLYLAHDLHFNNEGHRLFAEQAAPALIPMLYEKAAGPAPETGGAPKQ